jgi:hypothetical protein
MRRDGSARAPAARRPAAALAAGLLALLALPRLAAQAATEPAPTSYTLGGTIEARPFARYSGGPAAGDFSYGQATSLGLELAAGGRRARAAASLEAAVLSGAAASDAWALASAAQLSGMDSAGLLLAPAYSAGPAPPTLLEARIRSLYLKLDWDSLSLTAGRQVVNYRRGSLWSPTDPFTELDLSGISPVRRGSDALRLVLPLGATGAFDLVAAPGLGSSGGRYAARLAGLVGGFDAAALAWRDNGASTWNLGGDFKTDLVIGLDGQALWSRPDSREGWLRAALGADWSIGDFVAQVEYYYNGGGPAADPGASGSHNLYAALSWKASDFLSLAASLVDGLSEGTWSPTLSATLDAAQNASLLAYARAIKAGPAPSWSTEAGLDMTIKF